MERPRLFFHIGLHKTGTTWLQNAFFPRLSNVRAVRARRVEKLQRLLAEPNPEILLISHEGLGGTISLYRSPGSLFNRLRRSLEVIQAEPCDGILVGFREQQAWINSAYFEKAKSNEVSAEAYLNQYSPDELTWCKVLECVQTSSVPVFPFLYEELNHSPHEFAADLCGFLGTELPPDVGEILRRRENPSPRSIRGQRLARAFFVASRVLPARFNGTLRGWGSKLGAKLDSGTELERITFPDDLARRLRDDWRSLIRLIGKRRGRDFS